MLHLTTVLMMSVVCGPTGSHRGSWSVLPPKALWMSIVYTESMVVSVVHAEAKGQVNVHDLYYYWRP